MFKLNSLLKVRFLEILSFREPFTIFQTFGATMKHLMLQEGRLYSTHKRPN